MDLTSAQRKLVFAGVVLVLAALGAFLIIPATLGRSSSTGHGRAVGLSTPLSGTSPSPGPASQPATAPGGLGSPPPPGTGPDIYAWLPFSQAGLTAAVDLVHKFAAAYASYTYTQSPASYERQIGGLVTTQLAAVLARGFATPGVAQIRTQQKQIATGTGRITAIRGFGVEQHHLRRRDHPEGHRYQGHQADHHQLRRHGDRCGNNLAGGRPGTCFGGEHVTWQASWRVSGRTAAVVAIGMVGLLVLGLALAGAGITGGSMLFAAGQGCGAGGGAVVTAAVQPAPSKAAGTAIPANYLRLFQQAGHTYGVPWTILAGIGEVESNDGRSTLPGVHSGANAFGAAGPMQIGIGGAAGNTWGGAPVHPAGEQVSGVATDGNGDGVASVYEPADAIGGAAKYLLEHGVLTNPSGAIFAYNHLTSYVQAVLHWAGVYAGGGFTVTAAAPGPQASCQPGTTSITVPNQTVAAVIAFARQQIGKPYQWGGTGPDAFDCSGLMMMAYRRPASTSRAPRRCSGCGGPRVQPGHEEPGDLVFFAGSDGTTTSPGHVGLVIGHDLMIEAYATGFPIRISPFGTSKAAPGDTNPVGFYPPLGALRRHAHQPGPGRLTCH